MSYVVAVPEILDSAATDLASVAADGSFIPAVSSTGSLAPALSSPSPANLLSALAPVSLADDVYNTVNALSGAASDAYSTVLPTVDVTNGVLTSLPAYDLTLFAAGLQTGNPLDAIGQPIATDT